MFWKKSYKIQTKQWLFIVVGLLLIFWFAPALAQAPVLDTGLDYAKATGLVDTDIRIIIARIINVALGLLGIVAVALVIYGGYMYMTAAGNEEQITKAKKILFDAGIGLAIILSAFAITQFVIGKLTDAIMSQYNEDQQQDTTCTESGCPFGLQNLFYAISTPQGKLTIKNVTVSIVFMGNWGFAAEYDKETVPPKKSENIKIVKKSDQSSAPGDFNLKTANQIDFNPTGSCVDASNPVNSDASSICFEKNTTYQVILNTSIKSTNKLFLECSSAHPCVGEFTTGEKMDVTPPAISLNLPGQNALLPVGSNVEVSANYSDDAGVKMVTFQKDGKKIQDKIINPPEIQGTISTLWNTGVKVPAVYNLTAIAADVDNHETTSAAQIVKILPLYCFDKVKTENTDETGIDCGPSCGACVGGSCQAALDCADGLTCNASNICVKQTKITNVESKDGAIGNYITIYGENFGVYDATKSKVKFLGSVAGQEKEGKILSCDSKYTWKDDFIVVEVPAGAQSGPLQVFAATSTPDPFFQDRTDDKIGPYFDPTTVFAVNDKVKPGLGCLKPAQGMPKESVQVEGINFGGTQGASQLLFGIAPASPVSWSPAFLNTTVPDLPTQNLSVTVKVGGKNSNPLPFKVLEGVKVFPHISGLDPEEGPADSYVTIFGNDFGINPGKVIFDESGNKLTANLAECSKAWSDTQIIVKVPSDFKKYSDKKIKTTLQVVTQQVVTQESLKSNSVLFKVDNSKSIGPQLCSITPNNGPIDTWVKFSGFFGVDVGTIEYWKSVTGTIYKDGGESWQDKEILDKVEKGAKTGSVKVWSDELKAYSNPASFKVQNCQEELKKPGAVLEKICGLDNKCCGVGSCVPIAELCPGEVGLKASIYAWSFTTGQIPLVPKVIEDCTKGNVPSPSPGLNDVKDLQPPPENVCVNAVVKVRFSTFVKEVSESSFVVEKCVDAVCSSASKVVGKLDLTLANGTIGETGNDMATFVPTNIWTPDTWYRVTLTTDIQSDVSSDKVSANMSPAPEGKCVNPQGKIASYCFQFKIKDSLELCKLGSAVVSPDPFTANEFKKVYYPEEDKTLYNVSAIASENVCWAIDANAYDWKWNAGASAGATSDYATISNDQASGGSGIVTPITVSSLLLSKSPAFAKQLIVKGNYVLAAFDFPGAIGAIDISIPAKPMIADPIMLNGGISSMAVSNNSAYVLLNSKNLAILDIADFKNIKLTTTIANDPGKIDLTNAMDLVAKDKYLILSNNTLNQLKILNVADPKNVVSIGSLQNGEGGAKLFGANKMFLAGNYLYVLAKDGSNGSFGVEVVDISQAPKLSPIKFIPLQGDAKLLFANSQYLFASFDEDGSLGNRKIAIFDVVKGFSPIGVLSAPYANGVYASGKYLYLSFKDASDEYVKVFDISDSAKPLLVGALKDENLKNPAVISGANDHALIMSKPEGINNFFNIIGLGVSGDTLKGKPEQDLTTKEKETQPKEYVWAKTGIGKNAVEDGASLYITPQKPTVLAQWPECHLACVNAEIGAEFSLSMDLASLTGAKLYKCGSGVLGVDTLDCKNPVAFYNLNPVPSDANNTKFIFNLTTGAKLEKNTAYWVHVPSSVKSAGGSQMEKDFGWDFTTKDDNTLCDIDKVEITPNVATVNVIGDKVQYYSQAFGTADECNKNGQKLLSWSYNWNWLSNPDTVANITNWDKSVGGNKIGCNSLCQHIGSQLAPIGGLCGDSTTNKGEDCNTPDKNEATCSLNCLFKEKENKGTDQCSSQKSYNCCGNSAKEVGEDCDEGKENNGQSASGCSYNCLRMGTPISVNKCKELGFTLDECLQKGAISVCGNSGNPEPGEDCDLGNDNGKDGQTCTANCLTVGKKMIENPLCGNGLVESGEDADCDTGGGDAKVDPLQWATAVGKGSVDAQKQMTAEIVAGTKNKAGTDKTGTAKFILQCGFSPIDANCPVGVMAAYFGIGKNSCCYARPTVSLIQPSKPPVPTNVCPNTAITLKFSEVMDVGTFSSSTILGYFNIILAEATSTPNCPSGTFKVAQETKESSSWWNKIIAWFKNLIGQPAEADIYCAGGVDYTLLPKAIKECPTAANCEEKDKIITGTQVSLDLKNSLAYKTDYKIIVTKDVKSATGVSLLMPYGAGPQIPPYSVSFKTKDKLCQIDEIKIDPEAWWFNTTKNEADDDAAKVDEFDTKNDVDKMFSPHAYYVNKAVHGSPPQEELDSVTGYSWIYNWTIDDNSIVEKGALVKEAQEFKAKGKNGVTQVGVAAQISDGTQKSASSTVQVFICENPWPDAKFNVAHPEFGLGYIDADGTDDEILNGGLLSGVRTNFKLMYCRDAGMPNIQSDDLPKLRLPAVVSQNTSGNFFKEFFFTFDPPLAGETIKEDKNSIGLRVYSNVNHLPISKWYQADPAEAPGSPAAKGAPTPVQVGSYKALQEGRTYYIDGINSSDTNLYSNIYVFSFSDNPTAETLNIVNQLLSNFTLNVNVDDKEIVAKMYRDYQRLQDLKLISEKLWSYYGKKGEYPKLTENPQLGTYLPAYTNSKWKSWQGVLGNLVGYTLPVDPLNGFYGCASSTLSVGTPLVNLGPFDAETCWNAANSTFVCPAGSQVYQYETTGGADATLKADFELSAYNWYKSLDVLKPNNNNLFCSFDKKSCQINADCEQDTCSGAITKLCSNVAQGCGKDADCPGGSCVSTKHCKVQQKKVCQNDTDCSLANFCSGGLSFSVANNCQNTVEGESGKCGDGVVGAGEGCELGMKKYIACTVGENATTPWHEDQYPAKKLQECVGCSGWADAGACVLQGKCGDGVIQGIEQGGPEICDDGKNNGKYGYCKTDCLGTSVEFCGNGEVDTGKEVCDASDPAVVIAGQGWCSLNNQTTCIPGVAGAGCSVFGINDYGECLTAGAKYNVLKKFSCSWDCQKWDYCGDGVVNQIKKVVANKEVPYEQCEKSAPCSVGTCSDGSQKNKYCEEDKDCAGDIKCLSTLFTCLNGPQAGKYCQSDAFCLKGVECQNKKPGKKYCQVTGEKKYKQFVNSAGRPYFQDATTTASIAPTNELSYTDSNKSCGWEMANVNLQYFATSDVSCLPTEISPVPPSPSLCGNGKIEAGEVCDDGKNNGTACTPIANAKTCTYCEYGCQQVKTLSFP